ncbi:MAG: hypothetical protein ACI9WU_003734 [Myxococcota bacterium]|jgi:hypothetical protein
MVARMLGLAALIALAPGCADPDGTLVALTLTQSMEDHGEDAHFELFAVVNESAVSVLRFQFRIPAASESIGFQRQVVDYDNPDRVLGVVDGFDRFIRPIGGIRFRSSLALGEATHLFVTRQDNTDKAPSPSNDLVLECTLGPGGRGTLTCPLTNPDKTFIRGSATLVPSSDAPNPL